MFGDRLLFLVVFLSPFMLINVKRRQEAVQKGGRKHVQKLAGSFLFFLVSCNVAVVRAAVMKLALT
jgi:hypothetical protein